MSDDRNVNENSKNEQLDAFRVVDEGTDMTTNQGLKVSEDEMSLKAGVRGPTIMEDFHFREKLTHFDHERIPERVVHARGFAAHGVFELYEDMSYVTRAKFLQDTSKKTPVFVRFSTVNGSKGSADTVRDARGFATKFYTEEGNYDLVGNNIPVFFIQDGIKFPDLVHSFKPDPDNDTPQASTAHDTFWDFVANNQESAHMIMWIMSDRAIPRSFRMMQGFGVHTFRFVNEQGVAHFVKFHWRPLLGVHSLVWDESHKLSGIDSDFHRHDLWNAIENGEFPQYELGVQLLREDDEFNLGIDVLDATKIWPEEIVPVKIIGKMTLNQNVDNFFAETEQVAFHVGNVVPGIDFTNDPLLQGRLFSYLDTQLIRLGGPNFHEIPINRPVVPIHNNQREGYHRQMINKGKVSYHRNSLANNTPRTVSPAEGGYESYQEKVEGKKIRARSDSFNDHFSQATLFWNSMTNWERQHITEAFVFELSKVKSLSVRQQVVDMFGHVNWDLANTIAINIGVNPPPASQSTVNQASPALSMQNTIFSPNTLTVAVILVEGFDGPKFKNVLDQLMAQGIAPKIISDRLGEIAGTGGVTANAEFTFLTAKSVQFDAVYFVNSSEHNKMFNKNAIMFIDEAFSHYKPIAVNAPLREVMEMNQYAGKPGVVIETDTNSFAPEFINAITQQRFWDRKII